MGTTTAYELARRGQQVLLLEQFDFLHRRGSSHGESRIIRPTYPQKYYTQMMKQAYVLWEEAQLAAGTSVFTKTGGLDFGPSSDEGLKALMAACREMDVRHEVLSPTQLRQRFPLVDLPEDFVAVVNPDAGMIHATKAVAMFLQLAKQAGAETRDQTRVIDIDTNSPSGGVEVTTDAGAVQCEKCVVTVGAWAGKLVKQVAGLEIPVQPIHTTIGYFEVEDKEKWSSENFPVFIKYDSKAKDIYGCPSREYPGLIKVGLHGGPDCDPDTRSLRPGYEELESAIAPFINSHFKGVNSTPTMAEACMYTMTPDQDFILDLLPGCDGNVVIGAGFSGHGFKFGPLIGKVLADMALTGKCDDIDAKLFALSRFHKK
eukprot:CAMPEP_0198199154 /NCGR_PEP_ID=MMETSP1445-20131203/2475_1 /TAXON_ID=36898 /ORGANISM="Pyramimonas sp., Strain CCMP2087" /LENGTH=371 /DNA_ID=CAMNT_0043868905 /DNA_START=309 /DNA_END=1427 /DNA_ORIENTATION=+